MTESDSSVGAVSYREADTPITLPGLAVVAVKLLGLYALVHAIPMAVSLPLYLLYPEYRNWYALLNMLPAASYFAIGIALLWNADWVVARMIRVRLGDAPPMTFNEHLQGIAFAIVGVMLAAWGAGELASLAAEYAAIEARRNAGGVLADMPLSQFVRPLVETAAGVFLFFRGPGLASLWHRMRYGGVRVRQAE